MQNLIFSIVTQAITFLPVALAIYVSFFVLKAPDLTLDASFVLGAGTFARLLELHVALPIAGLSALIMGALAGMGVSTMQRGQKINALLAGVLATFILISGNLVVMGRPNISLLDKTTLLSDAFAKSQAHGYLLVAIYSAVLCLIACLLLMSRLGLLLRAFGDNALLLQRLGKRIEGYRLFGFAFTNALAAGCGLITAQTIGYADVGMSLGVTLTALGTVILGKQLLGAFIRQQRFMVSIEFTACLVGVMFYFAAMNTLLRIGVDPLYLKMLIGILLVFFLRAAGKNSLVRLSS